MIEVGHHVVRFVECGLWGPGRGLGNAVGIGFSEGSDLVAGCAFHNWEPDTGVIEITAYSTRRNWLDRDFLRVLFSYPFEQVDCRVVLARFSEKNKRVERMCRAVGAQLVSLPEVRGPGEAEVVAILTRDTWRHSKFVKAG